jgi:hypothetical protein
MSDQLHASAILFPEKEPPHTSHKKKQCTDRNTELNMKVYLVHSYSGHADFLLESDYEIWRVGEWGGGDVVVPTGLEVFSSSLRARGSY